MSTSAPDRRSRRRIRVRMVLDRSGTPWRMAEMVASPAPGAPPARCLVLSSQNRYVRLWSYPPDWVERTVDELLTAVPAAPNATPQPAG
jgi:hypothetical protein